MYRDIENRSFVLQSWKDTQPTPLKKENMLQIHSKLIALPCPLGEDSSSSPSAITIHNAIAVSQLLG